MCLMVTHKMPLSTVFAMNEVNKELSKKKPRKDTWKGSYHYHKMLDVLNIDYPYETDSCYHENGNKMYEGRVSVALFTLM